MDDFTIRHFQKWLETYVPEEDREAVSSGILSLIKEDPTILNNHSWPELRNLAENE